jgi:hypothetical protein
VAGLGVPSVSMNMRLTCSRNGEETGPLWSCQRALHRLKQPQ